MQLWEVQVLIEEIQLKGNLSCPLCGPGWGQHGVETGPLFSATCFSYGNLILFLEILGAPFCSTRQKFNSIHEWLLNPAHSQLNPAYPQLIDSFLPNHRGVGGV